MAKPEPVFPKLERIDEFLDALAQTDPKDKDAIWSLCMRELLHLKTGLWLPRNATEPQRGYKLTSLRSVLTAYRNAVRERLGPSCIALEYLRPSNKDQQEYKGRYYRDLKQQQKKLRPILPEELVDTAVAILNKIDREPKELVICALELLTGRRGWEIAKTGEFRRARRVPDILKRAGKYVLLFDGQAKGKTRQVPPYHIPVLADPELILFAFERLHALHPGLRRIQTNRAYNRNEGKRAGEKSHRRFFDAQMPHRKSLMPKDLRECYGVISYAWYAPDTVSLNYWISENLGHMEDDIVTFNAYIGFTILRQQRAFRYDLKTAGADVVDILERRQKTTRDKVRKTKVEENLRIFRDVMRVK